MQPLDLGSMFPLETYSEQEMEARLTTNPNRIVIIYVVSKLFGFGYKKAAIFETSGNWTQRLFSVTSFLELLA
jgi:hypothetical protein